MKKRATEEADRKLFIFTEELNFSDAPRATDWEALRTKLISALTAEWPGDTFDMEVVHDPNRKNSGKKCVIDERDEPDPIETEKAMQIIERVVMDWLEDTYE